MITISATVRAELLRRYPGLTKDKAYLRFARHILFTDFRDEMTGNPLIPATKIAEIEGVKWDSHYKAEDFLLRYRADVAPLVYSDWSAKREECRQVLQTGFDRDTIRMLNEAIRDDSTDRVIFVSGRKWTREARAAECAAIREEHAQERATWQLSPTPQYILDAMMAKREGIGKALIAKYGENRKAIDAAIVALPLERQPLMNETVQSALEQPWVLYHPSEKRRTCRLSGNYGSVLSLKSSVRKAWCGGWSDLDLASSQFVIFATILEAPLSLEFIREGRSIWQSLHTFITGETTKPNPDQKAVYKKALYSLCYGMGQQKLIDDVLNPAGALKLLNHPIIRELIEGRRRWYRVIERNGGIHDINIEWQAIEPITKDNPKGRGPHAVAATLIQSIEMELIRPVFEVVEANPSLQVEVMLFQHDGCTVSFRNKSRKEHALSLMRDAVAAKAKELGYETRLECEDL